MLNPSQKESVVMNSLFPEEELRNKNADAPWKRSEVDRMLELYLEGAHPRRVAQALGRNRKAVARRLEMLTYNERNACEKYTPRKRKDRTKLPWTKNDKIILSAHRDRGIPIALTGKVLGRSLVEKDHSSLSDFLVDLCLAYRFLYYVKGISLLSDTEYDELEKEARSKCPNDKRLDKPGSDCAEEYSDAVRGLAIYIFHRYSKL